MITEYPSYILFSVSSEEIWKLQIFIGSDIQLFVSKMTARKFILIHLNFRQILPKADIIFITHAHFDHFSAEDIARIKKDGTIIVATKDVTSKIGKGTVTVVPGKNYTVGKLKVMTVPAYNPDKKFHPKGNNWVGYIITLSNGQKIYHAGDTDFIPEMQKIITDIALLPCGGTYTMTARQAAEAANFFKPKVLIPMHCGRCRRIEGRCRGSEKAV